MSESEQTIRRYLLGELSETEQSALEEKYFTDPPALDQILKAESELVDSYVRGQLDSDVHKRFEQSYLAHPARSDRVKFAAALAARLDQIEETATGSEQQQISSVSWWQRLLASFRGRSPTLRFSMALATLVVTLGGVWIFVETRRRQSELAQAEASRETEQRREREEAQQTADRRRLAEDLAAKQGSDPQQISQPTPNSTESSAPRSVSIALTVGGVRGGGSTEMPTLIILPGTTQARLLLNLKENNYPTYHASLKTIAGAEVFSQRGVKPGRAKPGASFVFTVPAHKFASGDYVLTLRGINPDGEVDDLSKSLFRVEKK